MYAGKGLLPRSALGGDPMESAGRKNTPWRVAGVGLAASLCLAAGALGSALAAPGEDDFKDNPGAISTEPLFPADDGPQPNAAQAELAARITAIQTNGSGEDPSAGSLPYQVAHGILGISGAPAKGYTVILAKGVSTKQAASSSFAGLSRGAMDALTLRASEVTVEEITAVWYAVEGADWVAETDGKRPSYGMGIDDAQVVVHLSNTASDESRKNLAAISTLVRVVDIDPIRRS